MRSLTTPTPDIVDCHVHCVPGAVMDPFRRWLDGSGSFAEGPPANWASPAFEDPAEQVRSLDRHGIATGVVTWSSHAPTAMHQAALASPVKVRGIDMIASVNDAVREMCAAADGRLLASAWVDPRLVDSALAEIDRLAARPGPAAVSMLTSYPYSATGGLRFLDDPEFEVVLGAAARAGVPVFVHAAAKLPVGDTCTHALEPMAQACVTGGLGMLVETTLCVTRLVLAGVFDRHPDLQLVLGQLGGVLPFALGRFDLLREMFALRDTRPDARLLPRIRDYADHLYVDTHSMDGHALELALDTFGPDRVVYGSDFPVTPEELGRGRVLASMSGLGLEPAVREAVLGGNARALLGLAPAHTAARRTTGARPLEVVA
jgi:predicted TIM-barrel fold metal-dependent hydrolase